MQYSGKINKKYYQQVLTFPNSTAVITLLTILLPKSILL